jgi:hypothetical protein
MKGGEKGGVFCAIHAFGSALRRSYELDSHKTEIDLGLRFPPSFRLDLLPCLI